MSERARTHSPLAQVDDVQLEVVDISRLKPVGQRAALGSYIHQLWHRRHFITADSRARAFAGNRDTLLGRFWLVGKPVLDGLTYFLIFGVLLGTARGIDNYIGFLLIGVFLFSFTSASLNGGAGVMAGGKNLIRAFSFPRASIPLALALRQAISMFPVVIAMLVMIVVIPPHAKITWLWALFPVVFLLQVCLNSGIILYTARLTSALPDLRLVIGFASRFWMYGSGVMYSIDKFVTHPQLLAVLEFNPAFCVLEISRDLLLYGTMPDLKLWLTLGAWAIVTPVLGFLYFWQGEEEYGRE
ncbi:ABC transporter permease [Phycicoccus sp. Root101]|uniref:ABC transporter permease n=1 Tax=Phycicoccus sp. Root101 TaxID=1736421 RepID=UPI000702B516|nr:ABC transporter permease [Phycicoccus sp. Root101]KQU68208.1 ABC transporter [Phycicoccus sp. Root101]